MVWLVVLHKIVTTAGIGVSIAKAASSDGCSRVVNVSPVKSKLSISTERSGHPNPYQVVLEQGLIGERVRFAIFFPTVQKKPKK